MTEWKIQSILLSDINRGFADMERKIQLFSSHPEMNHELVGELAAIVKHLTYAGITKLECHGFTLIDNSALEKEKEAFVRAVVEKGLENNEISMPSH